MDCPVCERCFTTSSGLGVHRSVKSGLDNPCVDTRSVKERRVESSRLYQERHPERVHKQPDGAGAICPICKSKFVGLRSLGVHRSAKRRDNPCLDSRTVDEKHLDNKRRYRRRQRRLEYRRRHSREWRIANPTYYAQWRRDHTSAENERKRRWRETTRGRESRRREGMRRRRSMPDVQLPGLFVGHPVLEQAVALTGRAWYGADLYDPTREDAAAEAVLAILEGRDPKEAIHDFRKKEWEWRYFNKEMPDER